MKIWNLNTSRWEDFRNQQGNDYYRYERANVLIDNKQTFIDLDGNDIYTGNQPTEETCLFDFCSNFIERLAVIGIKDKQTFVDLMGNDIYTRKPPTEKTCLFDSCGKFSEGFAWVKIGDKLTFIDLNGNDIYTHKKPTKETCLFDSCAYFIEGFANVQKDSKQFYIDTYGFYYSIDFDFSGFIEKDFKNIKPKLLKMQTSLFKNYPKCSLKRFVFEEII